MSLHPVVGHEQARERLAAALARGTLPASLLLHGPEGVGKQHLALWLARAVVCREPPAEGGPCDRCGPCRMALGLEHPDIHWYFPLERPKNASGDRLADALEDARMRALAEVRSEPVRSTYSEEVRGLYLGTVANVRARAHKRATMAPGPVFVIGQAELLVPQEASPEAANALLKLLEEPPGGARFILTSSEPGRLLPTIRSRTVPMHVTELPVDAVADFLRERCDVEPKVAGWAAHLSRGSIGRALGFLPEDGAPGPLEALRRKAFDVVQAAASSSPSAGYELALGFAPAGARGLLPLFAFVEEWVRDVGAVASGAEAHAFNRDAVAEIEKLVRGAGIHAVDVPTGFSRIEWARELARGNVNPQLVALGLVRDLRAAFSGRALRPAGVA